MDTQLTKERIIDFLNRLHLTSQELDMVREAVVEASVRSTNILPCSVEYHGGTDPDGDQCGMHTILTTKWDKLAHGGGTPLLAHLGVKILFTPLIPTNLNSVAELNAAAQKIWPGARPMRENDWLAFSIWQKTYMDLNKILKGLPYNAVDLPDIRQGIAFLTDTDPECTTATWISHKEGFVPPIDSSVFRSSEVTKSEISISQIPFFLCVVD